jgi:hypothetical protein
MLDVRLNGSRRVKRPEDTKMNQKVIPSNFDWPLCPLPSGANRSVDYICGNCRTVLLHAESSQTHPLLILCTECGAQNSTDAYLASVNG